MDLRSPISIAGIFAATAILQLLAFHAGVQLGRWRSRQADPEPPLSVRTIVASILGLLSFILGFTFGLASSHFDARNQTVFDETIAIGAAYRRADFLPEPDRTNVRDLLREYLDLRLEAGEPADPKATLARLRRLQEQIWDEAVAIGERNSGAASSAPLVQLLSDVINVHGERVLDGMRTRIPDKVWMTLYCIMTLALGAAGYHSGLMGARRSIAAVFYSLIFAAVIVMIAAGDNPGLDQLRASHQSLMELRARLGTQ